MPAGRPVLYETVEELEDAIEAYFERCQQTEEPLAVSGLAYHLGMATETLRAYGNKDQFSATVKRAKQRVEIYLEHRLQGNAPTGAIFNLKNNFGWKDKTEQDHGLAPSTMAMLGSIHGLSDEELEELAERL